MRYLFFLAISWIFFIILSCNENVSRQQPDPVVKTDSLKFIERGKYLLTIGGCNDCHSPKKMGPHGPEVIAETMLSGYPANRPFPKFDSTLAKRGIAQFNEDMTATAGPWGISFAGNLTSSASGAGSWPFENFKTALQHGKWKGIETSRSLLPPMPWFNYAVMTDDDLKALLAFLRSTKPVDNVPPPPMQFNQLK